MKLSTAALLTAVSSSSLSASTTTTTTAFVAKDCHQHKIRKGRGTVVDGAKQTRRLVFNDRNPVPWSLLLPTRSTTTRLQVATELEAPLPPPQQQQQQQPTGPTDDDSMNNLPAADKNGIYQIATRQQHAAFLAANRDKLIVLKVFAPWCRACKGLAPKFVQIVTDDKYADLPLVFAELSIQHNKAFVKELGVLALPTIQFYAGRSIQDTFACGPSKVPILKRKLAQLINENVDAKTRELKPAVAAEAAEAASFSAAATAASTTAEQQRAFGAAPPVSAAEKKPVLTAAERDLMRCTIPYFAEMSLADLDSVLDRAKMLRFEPASIIMREGRPGRTFYVIAAGEVEICQKTLAEDPLTTPSGYLGTVINRLGKGDFFGERAMMTGEPRAASIRATDEPVTAWAFDKDDFPASSVLSGRTKNMGLGATGRELDDKYGVRMTDLYNQRGVKQIREVAEANQVRGSPNTPEVIRGVDTDEDIALLDDAAAAADSDEETNLEETQDAIFSLLQRFKMVRHVSRCFDYIETTKARWGDVGSRMRRNMLVQRLTAAQRMEFKETFELIDTSGDGTISLLELKRVMESIGESKTDDELLQMISKSCDSPSAVIAASVAATGAMTGEKQQDDGGDTRTAKNMSLTDFMGIMAEAEFYHLFRDIFSALDPEGIGFCKAKDLDRVLAGVRSMISHNVNNIVDVDVEDEDLLIDYEEFSRILLGTALV